MVCYLAGLYSPCVWNIEVNGPGAAVLNEIDNLKRQRFAGKAQDRKQLLNFLGGMLEFFYARYYSMNRTASARGTKSSLNEKNRYMDTFKDYVARDMARPHSKHLVEEMRWIEREPGCAPAGNALVTQRQT